MLALLRTWGLGLALVAIALFSFSVFAQLPQIKTSKLEQSRLSFHYVIDTSSSWTAQQAMTWLRQDPRQAPGIVELPRNGEALWLAIEMENDHDTDNKTVFYLSEFHPSDFSLYDIDSGHVIASTGARVNYNERALVSRTLAIPVNFAPAEKKVLLFRLQSDFGGVSVNIRAKNSQGYFEQQISEMGMYAIYFGAMLALFFYNSVLAWSLRDKIFAYYVLSIGSFALWIASLRGFTAIVDNSIGFAKLGFSMIFVCGIFLILFIQNIVKLKQISPLHHKITTALLALMVMFIVLTSYDLAYVYWAKVVAGPMALYFLFIAFMSIIKGSEYGSYLAAGFSVYMTGLAVYFMLPYDMEESHIVLKNSALIGSFLEAIIFSIGLAGRIKYLHAENFHGQQQLLFIQQAENRQLEQIVKERTYELELVNKRLQQQSEKDALTGIYNRKFLDRHLKLQTEIHLRSDKPLALIMCQISNLKLLNEKYGHETGDKCLSLIGHAINQACTRVSDIVARYGSKEFVVVLPYTSQDNATMVVDRIKQRIGQVNLPIPDEAIELKMGVSGLDANNLVNAEGLVSSAEQALS